MRLLPNQQKLIATRVNIDYESLIAKNISKLSHLIDSLIYWKIYRSLLLLQENAKDVPDIEVNIKGTNCSVLIRNCENCSIQIDGAVKFVNLEHCLSINLVVEEISDLCEISDCSIVESQVFGRINKTNLKSVQQFKLFIPLSSLNEIEINSFKSADIELYVSKPEGDGLALDDYDKYVVKSNCRSSFANSKMTTTLF